MIKFLTNQTDLIEEFPFESTTIDEIYDYFKDKKQIEVDTESEGFDPHQHPLLTLQVGDFDTQFVIDLTTVPIKTFKPLLEDYNKLYLLQNAKHDLKFFLKNRIRMKNIYDTFLAECILTTGYEEYERELGLDDLVSKYAGYQLDKSVRKEINRRLTARVIKYASEDVKYLGLVKDGQLKQLKERGLGVDDVLDKYTTLGLENRVVRVFADMEYKGVRIDTKKWESNSKEIEKEFDVMIGKLDNIIVNEPKLSYLVPKKVQGDLFGYTGRPVNVNYNSPQQKIKILNSLGIQVDSSKDAVLEKHQHRHKFVRELRNFNKLSKLYSSFGFSLLERAYNTATGRFHPSYWQILKTGRISVSDPNTNQIPSKGKFGPLIRSAFIPKDGWKVVGGDYSAMELRELAHFSQDPLWLKIFREGLDLHTVLCCQTFGVKESEVRDPYPGNPDITYRDIQKTINYGLAYGMSAKKLAATMNSTEAEAQAVIDAFFAKVPLVEATLNKFGDFATKHGYVYTAPPYKRIRLFKKHYRARREQDSFELGKIERAGKNTPIQGTNADITKLAMVNAYEEVEKHNYPVNIILSVYDEIQTEAREDFAYEWKDILQDIMEEAGSRIIDSVPIIAECEVTDYWNH